MESFFYLSFPLVFLFGFVFLFFPLFLWLGNWAAIYLNSLYCHDYGGSLPRRLF
jgi:hypothetical protein